MENAREVAVLTRLLLEKLRNGDADIIQDPTGVERAINQLERIWESLKDYL